MTEFNLTVQMEKYDAGTVEADLQNLEDEIADEDAVNTALVNNDTVARMETVRGFLADNKERIVAQHAKMKSQVRALNEMVRANIDMENADAEYKALVTSEDAQYVAELLSELNAMSQQYRDLLLRTGRAGRPPLF